MKTNFKYFIKEDAANIDNIRRHYSEYRLDKEQILQLPEPAPDNFERQYRVGEVPFDNVHGMGNVPDSQNVEYKGFVALLTPKQFLELALDHKGREESAAEFKELIDEGIPLAAPFLEITLEGIEDGKFAAVMGHEGRARMLALRSFCREGKHGMTEATKIPVHFFLRDGLRSCHITDEMIKSLGSDGIIPESEKRQSPTAAVKIKPFKEIFINKKKIDL